MATNLFQQFSYPGSCYFCFTILCMLAFQFCDSHLIVTKWPLHILIPHELSNAERKREEPWWISSYLVCASYISRTEGPQKFPLIMNESQVTIFCEEVRESDILSFSPSVIRNRLGRWSWEWHLEWLAFSFSFYQSGSWYKKHTVLPGITTKMVCSEMTSFHHWNFYV